MKKLSTLIAAVILTACSASLPELRYADGSNRIPINPKPLPPPRLMSAPRSSLAGEPAHTAVNAAADALSGAGKDTGSLANKIARLSEDAAHLAGDSGGNQSVPSAGHGCRRSGMDSNGIYRGNILKYLPYTPPKS